MRPNNFPALRIAQFCALMVNGNNKIFTTVINASNTEELRTLFSGIFVHPYWQQHSDFDKKISLRSASLGNTAIDNILINTVVPFLFMRGRKHGTHRLIDFAIEILHKLKPESNGVINKWKKMGVNVTSAAQSQALLELKNQKCSYRRCVGCAIGVKLIASN